jgi:Ca2+/Na+ antiporter
MEVRAPPHYYYYYYYYYHHHHHHHHHHNHHHHVPCFKEILSKYLTVLRHSKMFFVLKFELILIIGSNNVLTEGARKVYRSAKAPAGAALDRAALEHVTVSSLPKDKGEVCGLQDKLIICCTGVQFPQLLDVSLCFSVLDISSAKVGSHSCIKKLNCYPKEN